MKWICELSSYDQSALTLWHPIYPSNSIDLNFTFLIRLLEARREIKKENESEINTISRSKCAHHTACRHFYPFSRSIIYANNKNVNCKNVYHDFDVRFCYPKFSLQRIQWHIRCDRLPMESSGQICALPVYTKSSI